MPFNNSSFVSSVSRFCTRTMLCLASPQISFMVRSSRIHFSPMCDERTLKDVDGEAMLCVEAHPRIGHIREYPPPLPGNHAV